MLIIVPGIENWPSFVKPDAAYVVAYKGVVRCGDTDILEIKINYRSQMQFKIQISLEKFTIKISRHKISTVPVSTNL